MSTTWDPEPWEQERHFPAGGRDATANQRERERREEAEREPAPVIVIKQGKGT